MHGRGMEKVSSQGELHEEVVDSKQALCLIYESAFRGLTWAGNCSLGAEQRANPPTAWLAPPGSLWPAKFAMGF